MRLGEALRTLVPGAVLVCEDSVDFEGTRAGFALTRAPNPERGLFGTLDMVVETDMGWVITPGIQYPSDDLVGDDWRVLRPLPVPDKGIAAPGFGPYPDAIAPTGQLEDYVGPA